MEQYELYHDESKEAGYWHGMLLVPVATKARLVEYLSLVRENTGYTKEIGLKKVKKTKSRIYFCAQSWLQVGVAALMQSLKGRPYQLFLGKCVKGQKEYDVLTRPIKAKFIVFRERDNFQMMTGHQDYGSKVETTFRMGLKGGLHYLGNSQQAICIEKMHFDGHEHYQRRIDRDRVIERLEGLREYCCIKRETDVIDDRSSDHEKAGSQSYDDCQLLQLTDLLVGSFRTILGGSTRPLHQQFARPVKMLVDKYTGGRARMQRSRWKDSFCISQCYLENSNWEFDTIDWAARAVSPQQELFPA
jgi:hypothetical protein